MPKDRQIPGHWTRPAPDGESDVDPREPVLPLPRDLRTAPYGLSDREVARRLEVVGLNELSVRQRSQ
ncbi:MAG: cation-transporting P-type ATPase [Pseudonocardiaceae bacterium]